MSQYDILRRLLSDRPIAFHPQLARVLGGVYEALLFQQLAYWSDKGSDPDWIYKSRQELKAETMLSRFQQEQARKNLIELGVLREERRGMPARLHYQIIWEAVFTLLADESADGEKLTNSRQQDGQKLTNNDGEKVANRDGQKLANKMAGTNQHDGEELTDMLADSQPTSKSTSETNDRELSNLRVVSPRNVDKYDEDRLSLLPYVQDLARELNDQAPLASTVTRVVKFKKESGLDRDEFIERLLQARAITQERTASIRTTRPDSGFGPKPKMAYFLAVLEDLLSE